MKLLLFSILTLLCIPVAALEVQELDIHPRPDWQRPIVLLNGPWQFQLDPGDAGLKENWQDGRAFSKTIQAPYPWQSPLSGINDPNYNGVAWYQREVKLPKTQGKRTFLVFGAVDWQATVWINGTKAAEHEGGYAPFEVDLTDLVKPGQTARVTVRVVDTTDPETPTGKQTGWYTPTGGIWQSVYLEFRGDSYLKQAHISPDIDAQRVTVDCVVHAENAGAYKVSFQAIETGRRFTAEQTIPCQPGENTVRLNVPIPYPVLWSPENPFLYDARVELSKAGCVEDTVRTYFGMRKISRGAFGNSGHEYILLNNKPVYLRGALHQSFNPQGVYTHPNDEFIRNDYMKAKELGFNFVRIHIKVDEPRALYWADKLGVLLMCDMPCYNKNTPRARQLWEQTLRDAVARDFNHPSIISWCDFNETWGIGDGGYTMETQTWVRDMYLLTKQLDPTRLVEDNSPCRYDHTVSDINSWHFYIDNYEKAAAHVAEVVEKTFPGSQFNYAPGWKQDTAPLLNSEYGGVGARSGDRDVSWVFLFLTNQLRKHEKICGYVYTELSDIEWEHNGFLNYDRSPKEFNYPMGITLAQLQDEDFPVLDCPPYQRAEIGTKVTIPLSISHWSEREELTLRVTPDGQTVDGIPWSGWLKPVERQIKDLAPYRNAPLDPIELVLPNACGLMNIVVELLYAGERVAANYCVIDVRNGQKWAAENLFAASFPVREFAAATLAGAAPGPEANTIVSGLGAGYFEYQLRLPRSLTPDKVAGCKLIFEASARSDKERLDWPDKTNAADCPQTDGKKWNSDLTVTLNGAPVVTTTVEETADARGVLSHAAGYRHGTSGAIIDAPVTGAALKALLDALGGKRVITMRFEVPADAANRGGLALYGENAGAWPCEPTLVFDIKPGIAKPKGEIKVLGTATSKK